MENLRGDFMLRREGAGLRVAPQAVLQQSYELLCLQDLFLDYAGRRPDIDPVHQSLAALQPGSPLHAAQRGERVPLLDAQEPCVAVFSQAAAVKTWLPRLHRMEALRVVGMVWRECGDSDEAY